MMTKTQSFAVLILTFGFLASGCGGQSSDINQPGADQLTQKLQNSTSLSLNYQGVNTIGQGCLDEVAPTGAVTPPISTSVPSTSSSGGVSSSSPALPTTPSSSATPAPATTTGTMAAPSGFSVSFLDGGIIQLMADGQVLVTGTWTAVDASTVAIAIKDNIVQVGVSIEGDTLNVYCSGSSGSTSVSGTAAGSSPGLSSTAGLTAGSPSTTANVSSPQPVPPEPVNITTTTPSQNSATGSVINCPNYVYLQGAGTYGIFSGNGGMPAFKLTPQTAPTTTQSPCVYTRPTNDPNWSEFVASSLVDGERCLPQSTQEFECFGSTTSSHEETVTCPQQIAIGPISGMSYGEYGTSAILPISSNWQIQGDQMTLKNLTHIAVMPQYGPSGKPAMQCDYSDFGQIQMTSR